MARHSLVVQVSTEAARYSSLFRGVQAGRKRWSTTSNAMEIFLQHRPSLAATVLCSVQRQPADFKLSVARSAAANRIPWVLPRSFLLVAERYFNSLHNRMSCFNGIVLKEPTRELG